MTSGDDPERRVTEALSARAVGAGYPPQATPPQRAPEPTGPSRGNMGPAMALFLALLAGAVIGMALALISLLTPGFLPPLG